MADPELVGAIEQLIHQFSDCATLDDPQVLFGLFSDSYYQRLRAMDGWNFDGKYERESSRSCWPAATSGSTSIRPRSRSGRTAGLADIVHGDTDIYVWFVEEDGTWKIDEFHRIMDTSTVPENRPVRRNSAGIR